jgi:predicted dehydrogenase
LTLRIGFIGVGGIAQAHLKNVKESGIADVIAVSDINEQAATSSAEKYGAVAYTDSIKMLDSEKLDAVFVCVPPFAHGVIEEEVVKRGIHIFVEKPLGLDLAVVQAKADVIRQSGVISGTGYCLRYWDIAQEAKAYLADKQVALVDGYYCTSFVPTPWWRVMEKSGGQLVEQTTHIVDLLRYLGGEVTSVQAFMSLVASKDIEHLDIYDVGTVNVAFKDGGVGHVRTTFLQPDHRSGLEVMGNGFRLTVDGGTLTIVEKEKTVIKKSNVDFYKEQDLAFLQALETGDRSLILVPYDEALKTLAVTLAANESAQTGETVQLLNLGVHL